ncbi:MULTISPECIES: hypothetical protein [Rhodococcus]|uniref:hypothetical protein n=1 Tax=Rhodococcus TaxID=1827 RepID=UPI002954A757|nr:MULTISPECIES: hypothetical protein [Rhodococcus]MDV7246337.1 hypothetical protein [Rhodococcus oxybenzonivorans]MDV7337381.1 hypothetical protein [Rhodococcus oxybenzonivorans]MDV7348010.1 hypothetical protein [Rhodococcus oxybenzonivorans]MDV8031662.1 hypothetical protein [Rhodococcus sp. IEGM 27]
MSSGAQPRPFGRGGSSGVLRLGLHRLPHSKFPRLRSLASELADYDGAHLLDKGLVITIDGLESLFRTTATATGQ